MNRKTSTLISLGISVALVGFGIWFLYDHFNYFGSGESNWMVPPNMMNKGGGMGIMMILFWVLVIVIVGLLVSSLIMRHHFSNDNEYNASAVTDALNILKQKYARGELNKTEYDNLKQELKEKIKFEDSTRCKIPPSSS